MGCKWGYLFFRRKRLEPNVLPWQQHSRCHSISFVMYISSAKLEEYYSNISRNVLDWLFYCFSRTIYDVITFLICLINSSLLWKAFQISSNYFLLYRHFQCQLFVNKAIQPFLLPNDWFVNSNLRRTGGMKCKWITLL